MPFSDDTCNWEGGTEEAGNSQEAGKEWGGGMKEQGKDSHEEPWAEVYPAFEPCASCFLVLSGLL